MMHAYERYCVKHKSPPNQHGNDCALHMTSLPFIVGNSWEAEPSSSILFVTYHENWLLCVVRYLSTHRFGHDRRETVLSTEGGQLLVRDDERAILTLDESPVDAREPTRVVLHVEGFSRLLRVFKA